MRIILLCLTFISFTAYARSDEQCHDMGYSQKIKHPRDAGRPYYNDKNRPNHYGKRPYHNKKRPDHYGKPPYYNKKPSNYYGKHPPPHHNENIPYYNNESNRCDSESNNVDYSGLFVITYTGGFFLTVSTLYSVERFKNKQIIDAQFEAAAYIASDAKINSVYLDQILRALRKKYPHASDKELAEAILALPNN